MHRTPNLHQRISFEFTSKDAFIPSPRDNGHNGEIPMSSAQVNIMRSESYITISISIPSELLKNIELNIEGVSINDKLLKCLLRGYAILTNPKR